MWSAVPKPRNYDSIYRLQLDPTNGSLSKFTVLAENFSTLTTAMKSDDSTTAMKSDDAAKPLHPPQAIPRANGGAPKSDHLQYMGFFDFKPQEQAGWTNLGLTFYRGWPTAKDTGLAGQLAAWNKLNIPSLYYMEITGAQAKIWKSGVGLLDGWEAHVEAEVARFKPYFGVGKAIRGVALGDEMCCRNVTCWKQYVPYTQKLRALLGKQAILYTNECWLGPKPAGGMGQVTIAPEFDLFSVDTYQWDYRLSTSGAAEVAAVKEAYSTLLPLMARSTKAMIVAGTFGCSNQSIIGQAHPVLANGTDSQTKNVLAKLDGLFEYAKSEPRIGGFMPWHYANRAGNMAPSCPCDMRLGAESMPAVVARTACDSLPGLPR